MKGQITVSRGGRTLLRRQVRLCGKDISNKAILGTLEQNEANLVKQSNGNRSTWTWTIRQSFPEIKNTNIIYSRNLAWITNTCYIIPLT